MALNRGVAHFAEKLHVFTDLMEIFFTVTAELEVHYNGVAIGGNHYTVRAAGLESASVTEYDGCLVEKGVFATEPLFCAWGGFYV